ncbi:MAG: glycosyltransferase [Candidatus Eremiobacteraeota bacterium]|nr:glycosyltransferase [Candidatus Eremiobacteraeota bacterium]
MRLSVIIPTKNRPQEVLRCLASIYEHSPHVEEVVVVDQSSSRYDLPAHPNIAHLYDPSLSGASAARNAGAAAANGELLLFMDDDCLFRNDAVSAIVAAFDANSDAVGVQARIVDLEFVPTPLSAHIFEHGFFDTNTYGAPGDMRRMAGAGCAYRATLFEIEQFDETLAGYSYGEDYDLALRARRWGKLVLAEDAVVEHAASDQNRFNRLRSFQTRWKNLNYLYAKHRSRTRPSDRFWHLWWALGETLRWLRFGLGLPRSAEPPR